MRRLIRAAWVAFIFVAAGTLNPAVAGINAWTTTGPRGGWNVIAVDPASPDRLLIGRTGAFALSLDGGTTWSRQPMPSDIDGAGVSQAFAFFDGPAPATYASFGAWNLYKSPDAGGHWTVLPGRLISDVTLPPTIPRVTRLAAPAAQPGTVLLVNNGHMFRSTDDGVTYRNVVPFGQGSDAAFDAIRTGTIYFLGQGNGVYRSLDFGATWEGRAAIAPCMLPCTQFYGRQLVSDPANADRLYALGESSTYDRALLYTSPDAGVTWTLQSTLAVRPDTRAHTLVADPWTSGRLYAIVNDQPLRSDDAGKTWSSVAPTNSDRSFALAAGAPSGTVYLGGSVDGLQRSRDGGATWEPHNAGLPGDWVTQLVVGGTAPFVYLALGASPYSGTGLLAYNTRGPAPYRRSAASNRWSDLAVTAPTLDGARDIAIDRKTGIGYALRTAPSSPRRTPARRGAQASSSRAITTITSRLPPAMPTWSSPWAKM